VYYIIDEAVIENVKSLIKDDVVRRFWFTEGDEDGGSGTGFALSDEHFMFNCHKQYNSDTMNVRIPLYKDVHHHTHDTLQSYGISVNDYAYARHHPRQYDYLRFHILLHY
jgi:hypothetical protein